MRLPGYKDRAVESLGRHDVQGPVREAAGARAVTQAIADTVSNVAAIGMELEFARQDKEVDQKVYDGLGQLVGVTDRLSDKNTRFSLNNSADLALLDGAQDNLNLNDGQGGTRTAIDRHEVVGEVWQRQRKKILDNIYQGLGARQRDMVDDRLKERLLWMDRAMTREQMLATNSYLRRSTMEQVGQLEELGRQNEIPELLARSPHFTQDERDEITKDVAVRTELGQIERAASVGDEMAQAWLSTLEDPDYNGVLSEGQQRAAVNDLKRGIVEQEAYAQEASYLDRVRGVQRAQEEMVEGTYTSSRNRELRDLGVLNHQQYLNFEKQLQTQSRKKLVSAKASFDLNRVLLGEEEPRVGDPAYAASVQLATKDIYPTTRAATAYLEEASRSGVLPKNLKIFYRNAILSGPVERAEEAVLSYMRVSDSNKTLDMNLGTRSGTAKNAIEDSISFHKDGMDLRTAIESAREIAEMDDAERQIFKDQIKDVDTSSEDYLEDKLTEDSEDFDRPSIGGVRIPFLGTRPTIPPAMLDDYDNVVKGHYYRMKGNLDAARARGYQDVMRVWGRDNVGTLDNEPKLKRLPVADVYRGTPEQAEYALRGYAKARGLEAENLELLADELTEGDRSSWKAMWRDENDMLHRLDQRFHVYEEWEKEGKGIYEAEREERETKKEAEFLESKKALLEGLAGTASRIYLDRDFDTELEKLERQRGEKDITEYRQKAEQERIEDIPSFQELAP